MADDLVAQILKAIPPRPEIVTLDEEDYDTYVSTLYSETPWQKTMPDVPHDYWPICKCCGVYELGRNPKRSELQETTQADAYSLLMQYDRGTEKSEPPPNFESYRIEGEGDQPALTLYWRKA